MNNFGFQEPCCIENTLPILLRQYGLVTWQSNGDVTFEKIMKAVACMAGNELNIIVAVPVIDVPMLRYLRWFQQRGWLKALTVLTQKQQTGLIRGEMLTGIPLTVRSHKSITEGVLIIKGEKQTVIVQGSLHSGVVAAMEYYTTYCGNDADRIAMLTNTVNARLQVLKRKTEKEDKGPLIPEDSPSVDGNNIVTSEENGSTD